MRRQSEIDKPTLFEKLGYKPHSDEQWAIHNSTARFRIPNCGRRFGKSQVAGHDLTADSFIPDSYWWIVGPTYKLGEKEFRVIWDDYKKLKLLDKCTTKNYNVNQGQMRLVTPWNAVIEVVSAEKPDSLVGEGLDGVIMSEAARHSMRTWSQIIEPALSDKRGSAIFPSTPKGFNWFKGLYDLGQMRDQFPDYQSWTFPTWTNKAMYPGGYNDPELVRIRSTVSKQFWDQEYAGEFTSFEGQIYPEFRENIHVKKIEYNPAFKNYLAFDFGYVDPFCCYDIMVDPSNDDVYVWREYQVTHQSTWTHAHAIKNRVNPEGYHVNAMYGDPSGADEIATLALVLGIVYAERVPWSQGVEAIKRWLQPVEGKPKLFIDESCIHLRRQLSQLRKKEIKDGHSERDGQHDFDDHGPDTLRYFFNHYFVLGHNTSLASVYTKEYATSEAATFFTYSSGIKMDESIAYG